MNFHTYQHEHPNNGNSRDEPNHYRQSYPLPHHYAYNIGTNRQNDEKQTNFFQNPATNSPADYQFLHAKPLALQPIVPNIDLPANIGGKITIEQNMIIF